MVMSNLEELKNIITPPGTDVTLKADFELYKSSIFTCFGTLHKNEPNDPMFNLMKHTFEEYVLETKSDSRILIIEAPYSKPKFKPTFEASVRSYYEMGGASFLADEQQISIVSGSPTKGMIAEELNKQGYSRDDVAIYLILSSLPTKSTATTNIADVVHSSIRQCQASLMDGFSQAEVKIINGPNNTSERNPLLLSHSVSNINKRLLEIANLKLFEEKSFKPLLSREDFDRIAYPPDKNSENILKRIAFDYLHYADLFLLDVLIKQINNGKIPFVIFGMMHILRLTPALNELDQKS